MALPGPRFLTLLVAAGMASAAPRWSFDHWGNRDGWTVRPECGGAVTGGTLWLRVSPPSAEPRSLESARFQVYGERSFGSCEVASPPGLNIPAASVNKVRIRLLNASPATDGFIRWRAGEDQGGPVRFAMEPDSREWQTVTCDIDGRWKGTLDQIRISLGSPRVRGDIWIDWIEVAAGPPRRMARPDVHSERVVPQVEIPGITQADFQDAFDVLDECLIVNVPAFGFRYPVMGPGGAYGENWWQLDASLNAAGAKWVNQGFAEGVVRGFHGVENPDGRIDLWGAAAVRGQPGDSSSLPRFFELAFDVARRTSDPALRKEGYAAMTRYLDWWLSPVKRDAASGLVTAIFEETFSEQDLVGIAPQTIAPVDLNVAVALGCRYVSRLAAFLGRAEDARKYQAAFTALSESINRYLWNEDRGAYFNYDVRKRKQRLRLLCTAFDPLRAGIAPKGRADRLFSKLVDPKLFNWGVLPLTSIARTEPDYMEATGPYDGRAWFGDVWTMRNLSVVAGLEDAGRHDLAAELNWATLKAFNRNYFEYLVPSTGAGQGVKRYGWSASQYILAIVEHLFGIDYDRLSRRLRVMPHVPRALMGRRIALRGLMLPVEGGARLSVTVRQNAPGKAELGVEIAGDLSSTALELLVPAESGQPARAADAQGKGLTVIRNPEGLTGSAGVRFERAKSTTVRFE